MSESIQDYFIPFVRRGVVVQSKEDSSINRRVIDINLRVSGGGKSEPIERPKPIGIFGPGDVLGFNKSVVAATVPVQNDTNFRADFIPYIEFKEMDFLWRYSNIKFENTNHWLPWLSLIVLEAGVEFELSQNKNPELPPYILLNDGVKLPDLSAMWRWAHVHFNEQKNLSPETIKQTLRNNPHIAVARLMCPRRLRINTRYTAFVVPTYLLGWQAAMGEKLSGGLGDLSWDKNNFPNDKKLPYYYNWTFETGTRGDFETLAKQFKGVIGNQEEVSEGKGLKINSSSPGYNIEFNDYTLELVGALQSVNFLTENNSIPQEATQLETILGSNSDENVPPVVKPPIYGKWYTKKGIEKENVSSTNIQNHWRDELNLDFRYRIAAGLGVQYVKENQESLMESAWKQLEEVKKANQALNLGRFGRAISSRLEKRVFRQTEENTNARVAKPSTLTSFQFQAGLAIQSKVVANSNGKSSNEPSSLRETFKENNFNYHAQKLQTKKYLQKIRPSYAKDNAEKKSKAMDKRNQLSPTFRMAGLETKTTSKQFKKKRFNVATIISNQAPIVRDRMKPERIIENRLKDKVSKFRRQAPYKKTTQENSRVHEDELREIVWYPEFHTPLYHFLKEQSINWLAPTLSGIPNNSISLLKNNPKFIEAVLIGANHEMASELRWREFPTDMKGSYFRKFWDTTIYSVDEEEAEEFKTTEVANELYKQLVDNGFINYNVALEEAISTIEDFYEIQGELTSAQKNMLTAYEEAVEKWLLTRDEDKDVNHPIEWEENSPLGSNGRIDNTENNNNQDNEIVLLVKGDLLKIYPNTTIYLAKQSNDESVESAEKVFPVFEGKLSESAQFIGFPITSEEAYNYHLVLEEPRGDSKYGLDEWGDTVPPTNADLLDTTWQHFGVQEGDYLDHILPSNQSNTWKNSAQIAHRFIQKPFRVVMPLAGFISA